MIIKTLSSGEASAPEWVACAAIHASGFETSWDAQTLCDMAKNNLTLAAFHRGDVVGFIMLGALTDQTDIITVAVAPNAQRRGIARALIDAATQTMTARGVRTLFLEVAEDNAPARALYAACGFVPIGTRKNYYKRAGGRVSAVTYEKRLA